MLDVGPVKGSTGSIPRTSVTQAPLPLAAVRLLQCYPRIDQIATNSGFDLPDPCKLRTGGVRPACEGEIQGLT